MTVMAALLSALALGATPAQDADVVVDCDTAGSTMELNICAAREVEALKGTLAVYTEAAYALIREMDDGDPEALVAEITEGEKLWRAYVEAACGAVYTQWSSGTIRNVMAASCEMDLIRERTHHIWREYLVTMEGLAKLPEPELRDHAFVSED